MVGHEWNYAVAWRWTPFSMGSALTFAELDGTLIAMDFNHRPGLGSIDALWEIIRPRMRMFNVLILSAESLSKIAVLEGINKPENYEENIEA